MNKMIEVFITRYLNASTEPVLDVDDKS